MNEEHLLMSKVYAQKKMILFKSKHCSPLEAIPIYIFYHTHCSVMAHTHKTAGRFQIETFNILKNVNLYKSLRSDLSHFKTDSTPPKYKKINSILR